MKSPVAFALIALLCVPAAAQQQPSFRQPVERQLLDIEQEADKALLLEALMLKGRMSMKPTPEAKPILQQLEKDVQTLDEFIASKKDAIRVRDAELLKSRMGSRPVTTITTEVRAERPADKQAVIERIENAQIDVQLLQAEINLLQEPLRKAVDDLAAVDTLAATNDEAQRAKAMEARKIFDDIKARYVELSTRLHKEQMQVQSLQRTAGMGGMGGMGGFQ